jgi:mediator of RNA polymerase II transcription subunit 17
MSDSLSKLAHKIDFHRDECEVKGKPTSEVEKEEEEEPPAKTPFQPPTWPWDSVRNKLKSVTTSLKLFLH